MTSTTVQSQDEAQIRKLLADKVAGMRAGDADELVGRYAPEVVKFDLAPPLQNVGPQARDADTMRAWFATFDGPVDYEIRDLVVAVGADLAFCHSINRLSATPQGASQPFDLWFRSTVGLRKTGDAWSVVHEHNSTPFYMDGSFRASVDLEP